MSDAREKPGCLPVLATFFAVLGSAVFACWVASTIWRWHVVRTTDAPELPAVAIFFGVVCFRTVSPRRVERLETDEDRIARAREAVGHAVSVAIMLGIAWIARWALGGAA